MLIDVIVPAHGAGPVFRRCAASLIAHAHADASNAPFRLVIVLDGPADAESVVAVEDLRAAAAREVGGFELLVLTHDTAVGFLRSANRAMRESSRDVVLLNSDTQVTSGWLGRLHAAAYSDASIATATPFSNNATICSLPRFLDENAIPAGHTIDTFGALITRVSRREYPRLPTGVGFCLYMKRSVLDEIGLFDEAFGLGYGEEVDWCFRASERGYVHVLDDATFVYHEGARSFSRGRERRIRQGERMMRRRYPEYVPRISEFIQADPIAPARARVTDQLRCADGAILGTASDVPMARSEGARPVGGEPTPLPSAFVVTRSDVPLAETDAGGADRAAEGEGARPLPSQIETLSPGEGVRVRGPLPVGGEGLQRVLHLAQGWPPWASGSAAMAMREFVCAQGARREVFVYARMSDVDRADGSAVEYVDGAVRVRLVVINGTRRTVLSRLGMRGDAVGADFARFVDDVRPDVVHVHAMSDAAGQSLALDLLEAARVPALRAALTRISTFVMGSRAIADRYAAARVLPPDARVHVLTSGLAEEIERVYEEVTNRPRS